MSERMVDQIKAGKAVHIFDAYNCFAMDTITTFCFARSMKCLKEPSFKAPMLHAMHDALALYPVIKHIPFFKLFLKLPETFITFLNPGMKPVMDFRRVSHAL